MIRQILWIACFSILAMADVYSQTGQKLYTAPLGIQAYSFRKSFPSDVAKTLDTIKILGFTEIESSGENMSPLAFKKLCDERGIRIPSSGASYAELVRTPDSLALKAIALGANYVMCAWIPHQNGVLSFENAKQAAIDFNRAGKMMKKYGIIFCYHVHGYEFQPYENGTLLDYLFANTDPEFVSFEMDIFWTQFGGGDPIALLKKYGGRWKLMHLKDIRKGTKKDLTGLTSPENDVPLGTGEINIPGILTEAKIIGIQHYFIEDESNDVMRPLTQSIYFLKELRLQSGGIENN